MRTLEKSILCFVVGVPAALVGGTHIEQLRAKHRAGVFRDTAATLVRAKATPELCAKALSEKGFQVYRDKGENVEVFEMYGTWTLSSHNLGGEIYFADGVATKYDIVEWRGGSL